MIQSLSSILVSNTFILRFRTLSTFGGNGTWRGLQFIYIIYITQLHWGNQVVLVLYQKVEEEMKKQKKGQLYGTNTVHVLVNNYLLLWISYVYQKVKGNTGNIHRSHTRDQYSVSVPMISSFGLDLETKLILVRDKRIPMVGLYFPFYNCLNRTQSINVCKSTLCDHRCLVPFKISITD